MCVTLFRPGIWYIMGDFLEYPGMSAEVNQTELSTSTFWFSTSRTLQVRGSMSPGHLKITDEKVVFVHTKSGRKDTLKVGTS